MISCWLEAIFVSNISHSNDLSIGSWITTQYSWSNAFTTFQKCPFFTCVWVRSRYCLNGIIGSFVLQFTLFLSFDTIFSFITESVATVSIINIFIRQNSNWGLLWLLWLLRLLLNESSLLGTAAERTLSTSTGEASLRSTTIIALLISTESSLLTESTLLSTESVISWSSECWSSQAWSATGTWCTCWWQVVGVKSSTWACSDECSNNYLGKRMISSLIDIFIRMPSHFHVTIAFVSHRAHVLMVD